MICPKCGREIPDGTVCPCSMGGPVLSSNPALNVIKTIGSSSMFLTAVILYTVTCVVNLIISLAGGGTTGSTYFKFDSSALGASASYSIGVEVFALLTVIGLWLHYVTCRNMQTGNISTAGLTLCKVYCIINLVCSCLVVVAVLAIGILLLVSPDMIAQEFGFFLYMYLDMDVNLPLFLSIMGGVCIFMAVVMIPLVVCYSVGLIRIINRAKTVAATGMPDNRVSSFVIVMNWLSVVGTVLTGLGALVTTPVTGVSALVGAVAMALLTVSLSRYRREMTILMYPPVQPVYAQPVQPMQGGYAQPTVPVQPTAPATPVQPAAPVEPAQTEGTEDSPNE